MDQGLKEFLIRNQIYNPEKIKRNQEVKAKRLIDFYKQKEIIKYLKDNHFRKADVYRDANCIARCIAAKVFND